MEASAVHGLHQHVLQWVVRLVRSHAVAGRTTVRLDGGDISVCVFLGREVLPHEGLLAFMTGPVGDLVRQLCETYDSALQAAPQHLPWHFVYRPSMSVHVYDACMRRLSMSLDGLRVLTVSTNAKTDTAFPFEQRRDVGRHLQGVTGKTYDAQTPVSHASSPYPLQRDAWVYATLASIHESD
jgi:hypothetical protein